MVCSMPHLLCLLMCVMISVCAVQSMQHLCRLSAYCEDAKVMQLWMNCDEAVVIS